MSEKPRRGRPPVDDRAVTFRLNESTIKAVFDHVELKFHLRDQQAWTAARLDAINAGREAPPKPPPPTARAISDEARRLIADAVDLVLDPTPRPKRWPGASLGPLTAEQMREAAAFVATGGILDKVIYESLPAWWRQMIDDYEAREGEED